ncbi:hypothetical protein E2C01_040710 [Portunus trituberculatus]|uniref:Uncharacterized protein n=1 Tax=Portunus trituberculatus TaxID=210409 RepID=A0A5B7FNP4_PORTR|nr:hypothetical protein [Portunus trituberculatus]
MRCEMERTSWFRSSNGFKGSSVGGRLECMNFLAVLSCYESVGKQAYLRRLAGRASQRSGRVFG